MSVCFPHYFYLIAMLFQAHPSVTVTAWCSRKFLTPRWSYASRSSEAKRQTSLSARDPRTVKVHRSVKKGCLESSAGKFSFLVKRFYICVLDRKAHSFSRVRWLENKVCRQLILWSSYLMIFRGEYYNYVQCILELLARPICVFNYSFYVTLSLYYI